MSAKAAISPSDREFFHWVAGAAFANPFSEKRLELDRKIAGHFRNEDERAEFLKRSVSDRVAKLDVQGLADLRRFSGEERELMRDVFLFEIYHHFYQLLDAHIGAQEKAGDTSAPVPFGIDALARLGARGFSAEDSKRFLGIFF